MIREVSVIPNILRYHFVTLPIISEKFKEKTYGLHFKNILLLLFEISTFYKAYSSIDF